MLSNLEILCYVLGWQGGTLSLVCDALDQAAREGVINWPKHLQESIVDRKSFYIIYANDEEMRHFCKMAQEYVRLQRKREMSR